MLTAQLMKLMDDRHLVASLYAEQDPLTSTALLSLLNDQDIHEPDQLKALLDTSNKFRTLANDAGDFFTRLNDLVTTNQE